MLDDAAKEGGVPDSATIAESVVSANGIATAIGLEPTLGPSNRKLLSAEAAAPAGFISAALDAASQNEGLYGAHFDAAAVADARSYLAAIQPLRAAIGLLRLKIEDDVLRKKAVIGAECKKLYRYAQVLVDTPAAKDVEGPLGVMKQAMRRPKKTKAPATPPKPPTSTT